MTTATAAAAGTAATGATATTAIPDRSGGQDSRDNTSRNDRFRDRNDRRRGRAQGPDVDDVEVTEDDVLLPVAGILDVLENYAFIRTSGYLPGPNDVYVSLAQVKKYNLRKGDAVVGAIRAPREGESRSSSSPPARSSTPWSASPRSTARPPRNSRTASNSRSSSRCTPPSACASRRTRRRSAPASSTWLPRSARASAA